MSNRRPPPPGAPVMAQRNAEHRPNPFRSSRMTPGAIDYLFLPDNRAKEDKPQSLTEVVQRLEQLNWRGAIIGPHGTGKSTLLAALIPQLNEAGQTPRLFELHDGQRKLPWTEVRYAVANAKIFIVDGYEQLSLWEKWRLRRFTRRHSLGLLVTAHEDPAHLPVLTRTQASAESLEAVLKELLCEEAGLLPAALQMAQELLPRHFGNLREVLFALYDAYENGALRRERQSDVGSGNSTACRRSSAG